MVQWLGSPNPAAALNADEDWYISVARITGADTATPAITAGPHDANAALPWEAKRSPRVQHGAFGFGRTHADRCQHHGIERVGRSGMDDLLPERSGLLIP